MAHSGKLNLAAVKPRMQALSRTLGEDRGAVRFVAAALTVLFGVAAAINLAALFTIAPPLPMTHLAAAALSVYLLIEARFYLRRSDTLGLLSPALLALVFHFFLTYILGATVAVFFPWVLGRFASSLPDLDAALADTMWLAMLAAFCMLRGYNLGRPLARRVKRAVRAAPQFRRELRPAINLLLGMQVVYLAFVGYAIDLGVYGLLSTPESLARHADVIQYLNLALAGGTMSYFLILLRHFERRVQRRAGSLERALVVLMITLHIFAGALTVFKSQIVFPLVIAGFAYFLATRRMPMRFVGAAVVTLIMAYAVIEPFRSYLGGRGEPPGSVAEAVQAFDIAFSMRGSLYHGSDGSRFEAIASRFDLAGMTALAVDYVARGDLQADKRQEFEDSILLAPILAYVPRAVWPNKPSYSQGVWFNQNVRGRWNDSGTSVAMGSIGYLYMAGGIIAVVLGFLGFGILQALIFEGLARGGAGGLLIFLSVANSLYTIPTSFGPVVTGILRMLPVAFVAQLMLLRRTPPSRDRDA